MLENNQLEFLVQVLELGPRPELKATQANADRVLAACLLESEARRGSHCVHQMALRLICLRYAPPGFAEQSIKAAQQVLEGEVAAMSKETGQAGDRGAGDRGPLTRYRILEAETIT